LSGHGIVFAAQMAARLGDVKNVRALLEKVATHSFHYNSMVTSHCPDHLYYNLDVSLSYPRVLMEMLVFSHPGHIELMPGWPKEYGDGSIKGVLVRGGHKIDITWADGKLKSAVLHAGLNENTIVKYGDDTKPLALKAGETYKLNSQLRVIK
jgi:alpha-L-fucosidase 2